MDGITLIGAIAAMNSPFYAIVIHNAITSRINRKLLEEIEKNYCQDDEEET